MCGAVSCCAVPCCLLLQETGEIAKEFSVLSEQDLITKDIDELRVQAQEHRDKTQEQIRGEATALHSQHMR
jgi:hypothetical protein